VSTILEYLKRERDAFELFKEAYRVQFPAGPGPLPDTELNLLAPQHAAESSAESASSTLLFVTLDEPLFANPEETRFAEIAWL
jgi:hypothetical protein